MNFVASAATSMVNRVTILTLEKEPKTITKMAKNLGLFLATQVPFSAKFSGYRGELEGVFGSKVLLALLMPD